MNAADFPRVGLPESVRRLEEMPAWVQGVIAGAAARDLARRPGPEAEDFSLVEHACHLRDLEREGYLVRVRRMLAETRPALAGFDGTAVARERDYLRQDARAAAADFAAARRELLGLVAPLGAEALAREASFDGKSICLADLVSMIVEHDAEHRRQIEALPWR